MAPSFKKSLSVWFVVQMVLPFTAPLQNCSLSDLLGTSHHTLPLAPTTAPATEAPESSANSFVSPISATTLTAVGIVPPDDSFAANLLVSASDLSPSPQVQRAVLRL